MKLTRRQIKEREMMRLAKRHPGEPKRRGQLFVEFVVPPTMRPEDIQKWLVAVFDNGSEHGPLVDIQNMQIRLAQKVTEERPPQ